MAAGANANFYQVLGLERDATAVEVKTAYRAACLAMHPDYAKSEADRKVRTAAFLNVQRAYDVLSDPAQRRLYDRTGMPGSTRGQPHTRPPPTDRTGPPPTDHTGQQQQPAGLDPLGPMRQAAQRVRDTVVQQSNEILEEAGHQVVAEAEALCTDLVKAGADALRARIFGRLVPRPTGTALVRRPGPSRKPR